MPGIMFVNGMNDIVRYTYRLRPMGAETVLTLFPHHLKAERATDSFTVGYKDIAAVWLSFMPRGAYLTGFRTKIYIRDRKTITLDDSTYASFFTQERQGASYRAFVLGLIERVQAANPQAQIMGGRNFWMQAATIVFGAIFGGLLPFMGIMTLKAGQWLLGLMFAAFAVVFVLWTWSFIQRNRLRNLKAGVPDDLLPPA
jgi:hypothetical protein